MELRTALVLQRSRTAICSSGLECLLITNSSRSPLLIWLPVGKGVGGHSLGDGGGGMGWGAVGGQTKRGMKSGL